MRKRTSILLLAAIFMMLGAVKSGAYGRIVFETVRYGCIISPDQRGVIVGEWTTDCDGNVTGWGWQPGDNCTYTETRYGAWCSSGPDQQEYPYYP